MVESVQGWVLDTNSDARLGKTFYSARSLVVLAFLALSASLYFAWIIAPKGLGESAPSARYGLYPEWVGSREVLPHRRSPYRQDVTAEIQIALYGYTPDSGTANQQRFAYPLFFAFLFAPVALLPFSTARVLAAAGCLVSAVVCVSAWSRCFALSRRARWLVLVVAVSTYPVALALQLCQPTIVVACCLALAVYLAYSGRLASSGILPGLSVAKPHIAIGVLLPMTVWAIFDWRRHKPFLLWLAGSTGALLLASELMVPGWFSSWFATARAYSHYAGIAPWTVQLLGGRGTAPAVILLISSAAYVSYSFRRADPLFAIAFSVAAFELIFPFLIYNEIALLPAALWLMTNTRHQNVRPGRRPALSFDLDCAWRRNRLCPRAGNERCPVSRLRAKPLAVAADRCVVLSASRICSAGRGGSSANFLVAMTRRRVLVVVFVAFCDGLRIRLVRPAAARLRHIKCRLRLLLSRRANGDEQRRRARVQT